jgi:broad specificity phosphatase PhoE
MPFFRAYKGFMRSSELPHDDLAASLAARRELGPDYDAAFVEAVAERIEQATATRRPVIAEIEKGERAMALTVVCVSLGVSIPISAIAATQTGLPGLLIVWIAIAVINVAFALRPRRR